MPLDEAAASAGCLRLSRGRDCLLLRCSGQVEKQRSRPAQRRCAPVTLLNRMNESNQSSGSDRPRINLFRRLRRCYELRAPVRSQAKQAREGSAQARAGVTSMHRAGRLLSVALLCAQRAGRTFLCAPCGRASACSAAAAVVHGGASWSQAEDVPCFRLRPLVETEVRVLTPFDLVAQELLIAYRHRMCPT